MRDHPVFHGTRTRVIGPHHKRQTRLLQPDEPPEPHTCNDSSTTIAPPTAFYSIDFPHVRREIWKVLAGQ